MTDNNNVQQTTDAGKENLGRAMTLKEAMALTPEQKKERQRILKNNWWRKRYSAEKEGLMPPTSVSRNTMTSLPAGIHPKGTPEQRHAWAMHALEAKRKKQELLFKMAKKETPKDLFLSPYLRGKMAERARIPKEAMALFSDEELKQLQPLTPFEGMTLTDEQRKVRTRVRSRLYYLLNREKIRLRENTKARESRNGLIPRPVAEVETQPVEQLVPTPTPQASPCKLNECPNCGTRFYMVKGQTTE